MSYALSHNRWPISASEIEARIANGWNLPDFMYTDPSMPAIEDELIWKPAWQVVGVLADFKEPGDYLTVKLGRYPILVLKDLDGEIRAYINICPHKGALLVGGELGDQPDCLSGNRKTLTCRYHGWSFALDGTLRSVPDGKVGNLPPKERFGLKPVSVDVWGGMVFVSVAPKEPLEAHMAEVGSLAEEAGYSFPFLNEELQLAGTYSWDVRCDWKAFMEVNIECYHCPSTHKDTLAQVYGVSLSEFESRIVGNGNLLIAPFSKNLENKVGNETASRLHELVEQRGGGAPFQQYYLWPGNMFSTGAGQGNTLFRVDHVGPKTCRMIARVYLSKEQADELDLIGPLFKDFIAEDVAICNGVQIGMDSGVREWGPLLEKREDTIKSFARQVWEHLRPAFVAQ